MDAWSLLAFAAGLVLLGGGAHALVRGASGLAVAAGVSPLVIGLTVVAFGTSAPELAVSVGGALTGAGDVALGNAVGSNVFNVLAVLGASALIGGLVVQQRIVRLDVPLLLAVTGLVWLLSANGRLGRLEGLMLVVGIVAYTAWLFVASRRERPAVAAEYAEAFGADARAARRRWPLAVLACVGGLAALVIGARLFVSAATALAAALGVTDLVVGLTVVAAGTSLPELATSVIAASRGERDIAVGNVVGSNVFNLLAVLGASALVAPDGIGIPRAALAVDLPVALLVALVALPALATGLLVARWEGAMLLAAYAAYVVVVVLTGTGSALAPSARLWLFAGLAGCAALFVAVGLLARGAAGGE